MEKEFDKKLLISNIYFLVKEKGLKLGEENDTALFWLTKLCVCVLNHFSCVPLYVTLWTIPAWLLRSWDSPGKNTGVGRHALL